MRRRCYRTRPPLSALVPSLLHCETGGHLPVRERVLPTATTELLFDLSATRSFDALVFGAHSASCEIVRLPDTSILSAHFPSGCAYPFFGVPAGELHNAVVPLELLWGRRAVELHQLLLAAQPDDRFTILERCLLGRAARFARHPAVSGAIEMLERAVALPAIHELAGSIGLSSRQLTRVFELEVGLTPKRYARVQRFQAALRRLERTGRGNLAEHALRFGYGDQAHFNHDFREFAAMTPGEYLLRRGPQANHVPLA